MFVDMIIEEREIVGEEFVRVERKHGVHVSRIKSYFIRVTKSGSVMNTRTIIEFEN